MGFVEAVGAGVVVKEGLRYVEDDCVGMVIAVDGDACHGMILGDGAFHCSIFLMMDVSNREGIKQYSWVGFVPADHLEGGGKFPAESSMDMVCHLKIIPDGPQPLVL